MTDPAVISAIAAALGTIATAILTFLGTRSSDRKDITINDRQQLSKDEQQFRAEMREQIRELQELVNQYRQQIVSLEEEVRQYKLRITELEIENRWLKAEIHELKKKLGEGQEDVADPTDDSSDQQI